MSFDLCFWHEDYPITTKQAIQVYEQLCEEDYAIVKPHQNITLFLQDLTQIYPPCDTYPEEKVDDCPWSCEWNLSPGSVILCMSWSHAEAMRPLLLHMARRYELVCFDPQETELHLPPSLNDVLE